MELSFCSVGGARFKFQVLDYTTLSDIAKKIAKKINTIPETILFSYNGKALTKSTTVGQLHVTEDSCIMFQSSIIFKPGNEIRFDFNDITDTVDLITLQKQLFSSKDVIKASKAIYSKEHLNPQKKRRSDPDSFPEMIEELKQLGYDEVRCANALRRADYCIDLAGSLLMDNQEGIQEIFDIIEIIQEMDEISLDNQIDSIEKKKHLPPPPIRSTPSKSSLSKTTQMQQKPHLIPPPQSVSKSTNKLSETAPIKKPIPHLESPQKKAPKIIVPPKPSPSVLAKPQSALKTSLPPLRKI